MRTARLVGLSQDGKSLIVATERGEELAIAADDRLRAAVRGDRPRLGQLEIEMDSALTPREIQSRIRAGASLEEVAKTAGLPLERVERFAAPVLAEREHIAALAASSSVRRRGETSAHRTLRVTVTERLTARGVDVDSVQWDSCRLEDGRWVVTAAYRSGEAARGAQFLFDARGRFSVAANDEARWILGEQSPAKGPQPGRRRPTGQPDDEDGEPTLDLNDELALVRVVQDDPADVEPTEAGAPLASVQQLRPAAPADSDDDPAGSATPDPASGQNVAGGDAGETDLHSERSQLEVLHGMLGDGDAEHAARTYAGLSDATAVPQTVAGGWEPAIVVNYPVEPAPEEDRDTADPPAPASAAPSRAAEYHEPPSPQVLSPDLTPAVIPRPSVPGTDEPGPPERIVSAEDREAEVEAFADEHGSPPPAAAALPAPPADPAGTAEPAEAERSPRPAKRKRASVPSWDEIMFGGPKKPT